MTRSTLCGLAVIASLLARGDQGILMPTARRLAPGGLRAELWAGDRRTAGSVALGLTQPFEVQVSADNFGGEPGRTTASIAYYYLSPIADITPGVSCGLLDGTNQTRDGRRVYACATVNRSLASLARFGYASFTIGFQLGRRSSPMAGFNLPVARSLAFLAEYDGYRFNVGFEARIPNGAYVRVALRGGAANVILGVRR